MAVTLLTELGTERQAKTPDVFGVISADLREKLRGKIILLVGANDVAVVDTAAEALGFKGRGRVEIIQGPPLEDFTLAEFEANP